MILRNFYSCISCSMGYFIRYGLGDQYPQKSSFFCENCGEKLTIGYDKNRKVFVENLQIIPEDENLSIVNLHPEIILDSKKKMDRYYFPTLEFLSKQAKTGDKDLELLRKIQKSIISYNDLWSKIEKDLRLCSEKRFHLIDKKYGSDKAIIQRRICKQILIINQYFLSGKWKELLENANEEMKLAKSKPDFINLKNYLKNKIDDFIEIFYSLMSEYSKVKEEMLVTLYSQQCNHDLNGISSIVDWDKIEMTYGNIYEKYGDLLSILTGVNNINKRGNFNKFESNGFDFQKYLISDKANRCDNFLGNHNLCNFSDFYDANIRNGTHHRNAKIDKDNKKIILGVGKGGKKERIITFIDYIVYCNEIYARSLALINLYIKIIL